MTFQELNDRLKNLTHSGTILTMTLPQTKFYAEKQEDQTYIYKEEFPYNSRVKISAISETANNSHSTNFVNFRELNDLARSLLSSLVQEYSSTEIDSRGHEPQYKVYSRFPFSINIVRGVSDGEVDSKDPNFKYHLLQIVEGDKDKLTWTEEELAALPTEIYEYFDSKFCTIRKVF